MQHPQNPATDAVQHFPPAHSPACCSGPASLPATAAAQLGQALPNALLQLLQPAWGRMADVVGGALVLPSHMLR